MITGSNHVRRRSRAYGTRSGAAAKRLIGIVALLWAVAVVAPAESTIYLAYGVGAFGRQDLVFSPMIHSGVGPLNVRFSYEGGARLRHAATLAYRSATSSILPPFAIEDRLRQTTFNDAPHGFASVGVSYGLSAPRRAGDSTVIHLGARTSARIDVLNYVYGTVGHFGYHAVFALGPSVRISHSASALDRLGAEIRPTLLAWTTRSPYLVNDDEYIENTSSHSGVRTFFAFIADGHLESLGRLQDIELSVFYRRSLGDRWSLGASVDTRYLRATDPRIVVALDSVLTLEGGFRL